MNIVRMSLFFFLVILLIIIMAINLVAVLVSICITRKEKKCDLHFPEIMKFFYTI